MADCKKYNGSTWEHSLRKLTTATDTIATLPAVLYPNDTTATVGLKGNTVQNGTPTPDNPIMPQGTGERTANLLFKKIPNANIGTDGKIAEYSSGYEFALYVAGVEEGKTYTTGVNFAQVYALYENEPIVGSVSYNGARNVIGSGVRNITIPTGNNIKYIVLRWASTVEQTMFNTGSTALPYEPYGYKIPISSASTTTPVYLGEVETTRKIKKLVLTGEESWVNAGGNAPYRLPINDIAISSSTTSIEWYCSHYQSVSTDDSWASYDYCISRTSTTAQSLQFRDVTKGDITAFKQYLAQQYAAGTPVTVWYVLTEPNTGIVNEPLMKIGDYADEVSNVSIPVTAGGDTLSVDTTVQPSEVTLSYTGWHDAEVKEKSENLFDDVTESGFYNDNGELVPDTTTSHSTTYIPVNGTTYTISGLWSGSTNFAVYEWDSNKNWLRRSNRRTPPRSTLSFTVGSDAAFITLQIKTGHGNIMLNTGSTELPYEPYWK